MSYENLPLLEWLKLQPGCCPECGTRADLFEAGLANHKDGCSIPPPNPEGMSNLMDAIPVHLRNEVARRGVQDTPLPEPEGRVERPW